MTNIEKIMERFDEIAVLDNAIRQGYVLSEDSLFDEEQYPESMYELCPEKIKQFIRNVIEEVVNDLVGEELECKHLDRMSPEVRRLEEAFDGGWNEFRNELIQRAKNNWGVDINKG